MTGFFCVNKLKRWGVAAGALLAIGTLVAQWDNLGWPRPAWASELVSVKEFSYVTRMMAVQLSIDNLKAQHWGIERDIEEFNRLSEPVPFLYTRRLNELETAISLKNLELARVRVLVPKAIEPSFLP